MFELVRYVCELIFGSSLALSRECFDCLAANLHALVIQIVRQAVTVALRSRRTRLLGDDLQIVLKCRATSPLFGYCRAPIFRSVHQGARTLFTPIDAVRNFSEMKTGARAKRCLLTRDEIIVHVEWLAIAGEQKLTPMRSSYFEKSILGVEQELYLSCLQSKDFPEEAQRLLREDQAALSTVLPQLVDWCRREICECLAHSCRLRKRQQLASCLTIIDCLLENPSVLISGYLHILSPMIVTCLLYEFEVDEALDFDEASLGTSGHVWSLRLSTVRTCVKMLERSQSLVYDVFYIRVISRLIHSLTLSHSPPSVIYAILHLFERLGVHSIRTFLLPHLLDIDPAKIISSKAIVAVLERIARMVVQ